MIVKFQGQRQNGRIEIEDKVGGGRGWVMPHPDGPQLASAIRWEVATGYKMNRHWHDIAPVGGNSIEGMIVLKGWCRYDERGVTIFAGECFSLPADEPHTVIFSDNFDAIVTFTPPHPVEVN